MPHKRFDFFYESIDGKKYHFEKMTKHEIDLRLHYFQTKPKEVPPPIFFLTVTQPNQTAFICSSYEDLGRHINFSDAIHKNKSFLIIESQSYFDLLKKISFTTH